MVRIRVMIRVRIGVRDRIGGCVESKDLNLHTMGSMVGSVVDKFY